jgi:hypothetical protein
MDWITRFGLATTFAVILLGYVLWTSSITSTAVMPALERVAVAQERMAQSQADTAALLRSIQLDLVKSCSGTGKGG